MYILKLFQKLIYIFLKKTSRDNNNNAMDNKEREEMERREHEREE